VTKGVGMHDSPSEPARSSARWRLPAGLFAFCALVYTATAARSYVNADVRMTDFAAWHLVRTGTPWLDHTSVPASLHIAARNIWVLHAANGHTVVGRSPGAVVLAVPAYLLAHASHISITPGGLAAAVVTAVTVTLMFLALRNKLPTRIAFVSTCVFAFTTPVWSVAANGMWPHTVTLLGISGMAWASSTERWWAAGIFGGITLWGRLHAAVIAAVLGLLVGWRRRDPRIVLRVGLPAAAFLAGLCAWTRWMYGTWNPMSFYSGAVVSAHAHQYRFDLVNQLGLWVAPDRGVLVWTPVILVLLPALVRSWRGLPDWSRALVWGGLVYTTLNGALDTFTGGDQFYGYRYGLEFLACATPALALSSPRTGKVARRLLGPVIGLQALAFALGSPSDSAWLLQRQAWHQNAFVHSIAGLGIAGWLLVAMSMLLGYVAQRAITDAWQTQRAEDSTVAIGPGEDAHAVT
jgi:hypothetical protein